MGGTWGPGFVIFVFVSAHVPCKYKCGASTIQCDDTIYWGSEYRCCGETGKTCTLICNSTYVHDMILNGICTSMRYMFFLVTTECQI